MGKILRFAQNDTFWVVILNPSALLFINSVKDLILKSRHYWTIRRIDTLLTPVLSQKKKLLQCARREDS
jgi:hypothetical protein